MKKSGLDIPNGTELSTQICIVGAGAAGIALAAHLLKTDVKFILIEGSRDFGSWQANSDQFKDKKLLYDGETSGLMNIKEPKFLTRSTDAPQQFPNERERYYGGTTNHWGGQCRPLDPIVFEGIKGYPGWPVDRSDLDPYYKIAADFCKIDGDDFSNEYWNNILKASIPSLSNFDTEMYQFIDGQNTKFAQNENGGMAIEGDPNPDHLLLLNTSLLNIHHQQGSVQKIDVASIGMEGDPPQAKTRFKIKADAYVLAAGAVANARLLLLSDAANSSGDVGRYFMGHPVIRNVVTNSGGFLSDDETRFMNGVSPDGKWHGKNNETVGARFIPSIEKTRELGIGRCWFHASGGNYYFELAPNPENRITLSDTTDPVFGQKRTHINWSFSALDENTYKQTTTLFQETVTSLGGNFSVKPWEDIINESTSSIPMGINGHHLGTTRMSAKPEEGVVDKNLRTHDLDNLYIAGSSVWTSAGISNPTFTIVMFAIRLAEHLTQLLASNKTTSSPATGITIGSDGNWTISGKVKGGSAGLKIEVWDKDRITKDDLIGKTTTDVSGNFSITYDGKSHKELWFDKKPDIYFKVYDAANQLVKKTKPIKNADEDIKDIVIALDN